MEFLYRDAAFAFGSPYVDEGVERRHCHGHVGWVGGDTVFGGTKDGVILVVAFDRGTSRAGLAFVARCGRVVEVHAAGALEQVPTGRGEISKLSRGASEQGLGEGRVAGAHLSVG